MTQARPQSKVFWMDMEMTGLDPTTHHILEVAVVITDWNMDILDEYQQVVFQAPDILSLMDAWCVETHGKSGLTQEVAQGTPLHVIEKDLIALGEKHFAQDKIVLAGNSVGHDLKFAKKHMPEFAKRLHYRVIDVSSFKEVFFNRYGVTFNKTDTHRAKTDIFESVSELKHYLTFVQNQG